VHADKCRTKQQQQLKIRGLFGGLRQYADLRFVRFEGKGADGKIM